MSTASRTRRIVTFAFLLSAAFHSVHFSAFWFLPSYNCNQGNILILSMCACIMPSGLLCSYVFPYVQVIEKRILMPSHFPSVVLNIFRNFAPCKMGTDTGHGENTREKGYCHLQKGWTQWKTTTKWTSKWNKNEILAWPIHWQNWVKMWRIQLGVLWIMFNTRILVFEFVGKIVNCKILNENYWEDFSCCACY